VLAPRALAKISGIPQMVTSVLPVPTDVPHAVLLLHVTLKKLAILAFVIRLILAHVQMIIIKTLLHVRHVLKDVPHAVLVLLVTLTKLAISTFVTLRLTVSAKVQTAFTNPQLIARLAPLVALHVQIQALQVAQVAYQNTGLLLVLVRVMDALLLIVPLVMQLVLQLATYANQVIA
jgi:hypothetical protein